MLPATIRVAIRRSCHPLLTICISREEPGEPGWTELGTAIFLLLTRWHDFKLDLILLILRYETCVCLKLVDYVLKEGKLSRELAIVIVLDSCYQVLISVLDARCLDLAVLFELAQADGTKCKGLFVCFRHQIWSIHQAFEVGTVCHSEDMTDFMTSRLEASVDENLLFWVLHLCSDLARRQKFIALLMRCLHLRVSLVGMAEDERSLIFVIPFTLQWLKIMFGEIVLFAFVDWLQHADRVRGMLVPVELTRIIIDVRWRVHNSRDGVADCGGANSTLRRQFWINWALVKHIINQLMRGVVMLSSAVQFVRLYTAGWIAHVIRNMNSSLEHCFVHTAPCWVKLNRVGFATVGGYEGLEVSVVCVVKTVGLERLERLSHWNIRSSVRPICRSDLQPIDFLWRSDIGDHRWFLSNFCGVYCIGTVVCQFIRSDVHLLLL